MAHLENESTFSFIMCNCRFFDLNKVLDIIGNDVNAAATDIAIEHPNVCALAVEHSGVKKNAIAM